MSKQLIFQLINNRQRISFWVLIAIGFSIPLKPSINSFLLILAFTVTASLYWSDLKKQLRERVLYIPLMGFFILYLANFILTPEAHTDRDTVNHLTLKIQFLIVPLIFIPLKFDQKQYFKIYIAFFISCLVIVLLSLTYGLSLVIKSNSLFYINESNQRAFYLHMGDLMRPYYIHPSYFSLYLVFLILVALNYLHNWVDTKFKYFFIFCIFLFTLFIFLLSARAALLSFFICLITYFIVTLSEHSRVKVVTFVMFILFSFVLIGNLKYTRERISLAYNALVSGPSLSETHSANSRLLIWQAAFEVIKEKPVFGHGIVNRETPLFKEYAKIGFVRGIEFQYNSHSEWLQLLIVFGIAGLLFFFFVLLFPLKKINSRNKKVFLLYLFFLILIIINFTTESMLSVQKGVAFFSFFYCLIISMSYQSERSG
ncbi:MAG: O-antigen ligase family protein [Chlorobi bacterium]|nr:O-antigen ligase family protein [Chlorobiota bacterium]